MIIVEGGLKTYNYKPYDTSTAKTFKALDTSNMTVSLAPTFLLYKLLKQRPDLGYSSNIDITQARRKVRGKWDYEQRKYIYNEKTLNSWVKKGAKPITNQAGEFGGTFLIEEMEVKPWLNFRYDYDSGKIMCKDILDFGFFRMWVSNGMGKRGQPKHHLMIWYNDRLIIIDYEAMQDYGKFLYRNSANNMWIEYPVEDTIGFEHGYNKKGDPKKSLYCQPTFVYIKDGHTYLDFNFIDRYEREDNVYEFTVDLDKFNAIQCTKGQLYNHFFIKGNMLDINGFIK